ncbi:helix-turn-helix transcriptional regulator [Phaeovulum vinaykumarii]|uniref:LuxR family transcriptional regulator n=1 Tax=Phaeovulum vinaykumarii TaxID=407234 RepID=A0A1N7LHR3_9RHOB|nr:LuxR family transcriptional regulator [Phaeovulum vinaykumarii]SIS73378.1 LuxR family transcriptional regulator [Phaeovulum vinaykumarii]SOC04677.1 LuxR family transcriptional regulator [Phaeovulum vinaykumarii]
MLDHIEKLFQARSLDEVWALHTAKMKRFGFDRLLYGYVRFRSAIDTASLDDTLILSNHTNAYLEAFFGAGLYRHAPMVDWAVSNEGVRSWREVAEAAAQGKLSPMTMRVLEVNAAHGVVAGLSISFQAESPRSKAAIGLCAAPGLDQDAVDRIWARHGREILALNNLMHMRITALPFVCASRLLTPRQREVLEWVGDGKTAADIGEILNVSVATVEKHLRLAREVLGVETTAQAVLKASMQRQIFLVPDESEPQRGLPLP